MKIKIIFLVSVLVLNINAKILETKQVFNIKTVKVKKENTYKTNEYYGNTEINDNKIISIKIKFNGYVKDTKNKSKLSKIKANQTILEVYSDEIKQLTNEYNILNEPITKEIAESIKEKLANYEINKSQIEKIILRNNGIVEIKTDVNGIILNKNYYKETYLQKNKEVLRIGNLEDLWFIAEVYEKDLKELKNENDYEVYLEGTNKKYNVLLDYIYPSIDEKTKTVKVRFVLRNKGFEVFPNMFGKLKVKNKKNDILTLPKTAVLNKATKYYVFIIDEGKNITPKEVEVKRISQNKYQINKGLEEGEKVVNDILFLMDSDAISNGLYDTDNEDW